ncbi:uncharacterized protein LOC129318436 isoform X2 [Prosopis cineraria]|uniref:uncharacterized protein LOC129318436 isoform X2 n=1 Tax=Prosopis cineraria TaxID=364024 RepID=UPI00240EC3ED|nr:uncharacterized protein LOC129318436 isoform X2 [Prosopis cineraria]
MMYIMPASLAGGLSQLEILEIELASSLEYVFGEDNNDIIQNLKQSIDLPVLKAFKLTNLPNIISITPENYDVNWPSLDGPQIRGCPKLIGMANLDPEERQQGDDKATKQDLEIQMIEDVISTKSNSKLEDLPQEDKSHGDEQEAIEKVEEERHNDIEAEDKNEKEAEQHKEEKYAIPEDKSDIIGQSDASCVESRQLDEGRSRIVKGSLHKDPKAEESKAGTSSMELIENQSKVELDLPLVVENPQQALEEIKDSHEVQAAVEVHPQSQKIDVIDDTQEGPQEKNLNPDGSMNLREINTDIATVSLRKDPVSEESTVKTLSPVLIDKQPQAVMDPQQDYRARHQEVLPEDSHNEVQGASEFQLHSQKIDAIADPPKSLQEKHLFTVGSMNSRERNTEIVKESLHRDPALEETTVGSSSLELIEKQPKVKLQLSQFVVDPQEPLEEYKVLSPITGIAEGTTSSSRNQQLSPKELVDFHGLFKIKARRAQLLEEAFDKYPRLWQWMFSQKTPRFCKWGYKTLADMLEFLTSEPPNAIMDGLKRKKYEDLCLELESFGFDKDWLASIRQRVMDMQVDRDEKMKQLVELEYQVSTLKDQLNVARARMDSIKDDLSKLDVIGF